jgi:hypothetical protein
MVKEKSESKEIPAAVIKNIEQKIMTIRGIKVMLDSDLAMLYGVETKRFNEQVRRNIDRFPEDFMFQLSKEEFKSLRSQFATTSERGGRRYPPLVFTEHGAIMAASILNTKQAVGVSLYVVRAFVKLREFYSFNRELALKVSELDRKVTQHDGVIKSLVQVIKKMAMPPSKRKIGFQSDLDSSSEDSDENNI